LRSNEPKPDYLPPLRAPKGAPNVLVVLLSDVGFGATNTFGGPIASPTLDRLAKGGLLYNRFHTTGMSSPTRAALLTGRNHHTVHSGTTMEMAHGLPAYDGLIGKDTATVAELLRLNGYSTALFGKHPNVPDWEISAAGPFDRWPTGLGFDYFYGILGHSTNDARALVYEGTRALEPYLGNTDYSFDYDLADQAAKWLQSQRSIAPDRPFFAYYAPAATHMPHQPKKEWVEKYRGKFDQGWDKMREDTFNRQKQFKVIPEDAKMNPRPAGLPSWESTTPEEKKLFARMMELYAGYLEQVDFNVGRVLKSIEDMGQLDNTLVVYIAGDNGASTEGGPVGTLNGMTSLSAEKEDVAYLTQKIDQLGTAKAFNHMPVAWAQALNTPFSGAKSLASHLGGTRTGAVIAWPRGIGPKNEVRTQFHHVIDIAPTILEVAGLPHPTSVNGLAQKAIEGVSMAYTFAPGKAPGRHRSQHFEGTGSTAMYHDGWMASTTPASQPWEPAAAPQDWLTTSKWELYNLDADFGQATDLAEKETGRLRELQTRFLVEAARYNVYPIDTARVDRTGEASRPSLTRGRSSFTYFAGTKRIPESAAPDVKTRSWSAQAEVEVKNDSTGIILTQGGQLGGWAWYLNKGKPVFQYNYAGQVNTAIASIDAVSNGKRTLRVEVVYDTPGSAKGATVSLSVDGKVVAKGKLPKTQTVRFSSDETFDVGEDTGTTVDPSYDVPFKFTGKLNKVTLDLK
jgi:arylsulfatase